MVYSAVGGGISRIEVIKQWAQQTEPHRGSPRMMVSTAGLWSRNSEWTSHKLQHGIKSVIASVVLGAVMSVMGPYCKVYGMLLVT